MDVQTTPAGGVGCLATILTFGIAARVQKKQEAQFPARLDETGMDLRNGQRVAWDEITRFRATKVIVYGRHMHTLYELWHKAGVVRIISSRIANIDDVLAYITDRLPPDTPMR